MLVVMLGMFAGVLVMVVMSTKEVAEPGAMVAVILGAMLA